MDREVLLLHYTGIFTTKNCMGRMSGVTASSLLFSPPNPCGLLCYKSSNQQPCHEMHPKQNESSSQRQRHPNQNRITTHRHLSSLSRFVCTVQDVSGQAQSDKIQYVSSSYQCRQRAGKQHTLAPLQTCSCLRYC
ncbi:hypothetical protein DUNSADRAFT_10696 [Dunaliella salina]|uniref:Encoded protein n=1 Tax=Dunaliella salina TaxID=3046 RepID=A0ABQ7GEN8_DUNSA|nr:hypothetical protein DUNSADRAFT_10696 [Dunaliella salina]|eukprot:KAF5833077.1 hypothetical protein DUNSADRAFT_10696 [Dunaliella salina]